MKRIAIKLVVFLLLGAMINVGVAWGCAVFVDVPLDSVRSTVWSEDDIVLQVSVGLCPGACMVYWRQHELHLAIADAWMRMQGAREDFVDDLPIPQWSRPPGSEIPAREGGWARTRHSWEVATGWPAISMSCQLTRGNGFTVVRGLELPDRPRRGLFDAGGQALPLTPIWTGFAFNTVFYAVPLWLLWSGTFAARRSIRQWRYRCIHCGYDLGHAAHEVCPECGIARVQEEAPLRRAVVMILVFPLLGSVTTVGVAWVSAAQPLPEQWALDHHGYIDGGDGRYHWWVGRLERLGRTRLYSAKQFEQRVDVPATGNRSKTEMIPGWAAPIAGIAPSSERATIHAEATGWPLRAMRSHFEQVPGVPVIKVHGSVFGKDLPLPGMYRRILPLRPIFPGFLINTFFYAVILWLLWSAPFATRRLIRKRRGRCVRCGYDLSHAEHDACPECGSA